jgi:LPXTG-motif cell wall-anchored protein
MKNKTPKTIKHRLRKASQWLLVGLLTTSTTLPGIATMVTASTEEPNVSQAIDNDTDIDINDKPEEVEQDDNTENVEVSDTVEELDDEVGKEKGITSETVQITSEETASDEIASENNLKAEDDIASGNWGDTPWRIDSDFTLHIGGGHLGLRGFSSYAPDYYLEVKKIVFDEEVRVNGDSNGALFAGMRSVVEFENIANLNTSDMKSMFSMFANMSSLTSLDLSNFDTSNVTDMSAMFHQTTSLKSIDVSSLDTSNVTDMSNMFGYMSSLENLDVSNFNTSEVTSMNSMFSGISSITNLDLSNFDTSNVTDMADMFHRTGLSRLDISNFNTSKVANMHGMFAESSALMDLDLTNFDTSNVTDMARMFMETSSLSSLDLSNFDTSNVTNMSYMFENMSGVRALDLSNFNTSNVTNMSYMFNFMSNLSTLDVSSFDTENVTNMGYMFRYTRISDLDLTNFDTTNATDMSRMFSDMSALISLNISNFDTTSMPYMYKPFYGTYKLSELTLGKNFDFGEDADLPEHLESDTYTGRWINVGTGSLEAPEGKNIWSSAELMTNYNGGTDADTYIWQRQPVARKDVTVKYEDESGKSIADEETLQGKVGEDYNSVQKDIEGYTFKEVKDDNTSGKFTDQAQTVIYIYTKNPVAGKDVTVKYEDESGKSIADEETLQGNIGEEYNSIQKDIDGYTFKEVKDDNPSGKFTDQAQTVIYIYTKNPVNEEDLSHITVHDSDLKVGDNWSPEDNFGEATDFDGKVEKFSDIIVEGSVDTKKAGTYEVTYTIPKEHWSKSSSVEGVHSATAKIVVSEEDTETDVSGSESNNSGNNTGSSDKDSSLDNGVLLTNVQNNLEQIKQKNQILPQTGEHFSAIAFMAGLSLLVLGSLFAVLRFKKNK